MCRRIVFLFFFFPFGWLQEFEQMEKDRLKQSKEHLGKFCDLHIQLLPQLQEVSLSWWISHYLQSPIFFPSNSPMPGSSSRCTRSTRNPTSRPLWIRRRPGPTAPRSTSIAPMSVSFFAALFNHSPAEPSLCPAFFLCFFFLTFLLGC